MLFFFYLLKLEAQQLEEGVFHRRRGLLLNITLTHQILWIGSFYIQLLDPVYLACQFSEITVEIDKEITFEYTKLAVKTVKCY